MVKPGISPECEFKGKGKGNCTKPAEWFAVFGNIIFTANGSPAAYDARLCTQHMDEVHDHLTDFGIDELISRHINPEKLCYNCHLRYHSCGPWCRECSGALEAIRKIRSTP